MMGIRMADDPRLIQLTKLTRAKVAAVLADVRSAGYDPVIVEGLRSYARQRELVKKGRSRTMRSKHLPHGEEMLSRAADICERGKGWNSRPAFWLTLGRCALLHGLGWGGTWIGSRLSLRDRRLRSELVKFVTDQSRAWDPSLYLMDKRPIGWDPAHVELP